MNLTVEVDALQGFDLDDVEFELIDDEGSEAPFSESIPLATVADLSAGRFRLAATYTAITVAEPVGACDQQIGHESHGGAGFGYSRVPEST